MTPDVKSYKNFIYKNFKMKKMKTIKLTLVALATIFSFGLANAQNDGMGLQAGYSSESVVNGLIPSLKGFHVGPTYEMSIQGPISLQYGLLYNYLTGSKNVLLVEGKETKHTLDIPFRLAATFPLSGELKAFVFGGANFNVGISDKINDVDVYSQEITLFGTTYKASRFDLQLGAGGGIQYNNFGVKAGYDWGMLDRSGNIGLGTKANDLKVSLFYNF